MSNIATQFKKGEVANPNGRPKRAWTWSGVLQDAVEQVVINKQGNTKTVKELVAQSLVEEAQKGNVVAAKELMNRMDGMPQQDIKAEVSVEGVIIYTPEKNKE